MRAVFSPVPSLNGKHGAGEKNVSTGSLHVCGIELVISSSKYLLIYQNAGELNRRQSPHRLMTVTRTIYSLPRCYWNVTNIGSEYLTHSKHHFLSTLFAPNTLWHIAHFRTLLPYWPECKFSPKIAGENATRLGSLSVSRPLHWGFQPPSPRKKEGGDKCAYSSHIPGIEIRALEAGARSSKAEGSAKPRSQGDFYSEILARKSSKTTRGSGRTREYLKRRRIIFLPRALILYQVPGDRINPLRVYAAAAAYNVIVMHGFPCPLWLVMCTRGFSEKLYEKWLLGL